MTGAYGSHCSNPSDTYREYACGSCVRSVSSTIRSYPRSRAKVTGGTHQRACGSLPAMRRFDVKPLHHAGGAFERDHCRAAAVVPVDRCDEGRILAAVQRAHDGKRQRRAMPQINRQVAFVLGEQLVQPFEIRGRLRAPHEHAGAQCFKMGVWPKPLRTNCTASAARMMPRTRVTTWMPVIPMRC